MQRALLAAVLAFALGGLARAQPAPLTTDPHFQPRPAAPVAPAVDPLLDAAPILVELPKGPTDENIRVSLDVGLPTGVRLQARLFESRFWAEVGVGVWWIVPYASTALRYDLRLYEGQRDTFAVRPSVSATIIPLGDVYYGFGGDTEFIWQHRFSNRLITDLGFRLGASAIRNSRNYHNSHNTWIGAPVLALVLAAQF